MYYAWNVKYIVQQLGLATAGHVSESRNTGSPVRHRLMEPTHWMIFLTFLLELSCLPCSWFNIGSHFILLDMDIAPCYKISVSVKLLLPPGTCPYFTAKKLVVSDSEVTHNLPWQKLQTHEDLNTLCRRIRRSLKQQFRNLRKRNSVPGSDYTLGKSLSNEIQFMLSSRQGLCYWLPEPYIC